MSQTLRGAAKPGMLPRLRIFIIGLLVSFALPAVDGNASWQVEWEKTLEAARAEGSVAVYATSSVGNLRIIWEAFRKRYPKIKLINVVPGRGTAGVIRIMAEDIVPYRIHLANEHGLDPLTDIASPAGLDFVHHHISLLKGT